MYKFTIDTDSKKLSSVDVYADAEKTTKLATPLDAVMRYKQTVRIAFAGTRAFSKVLLAKLIFSVGDAKSSLTPCVSLGKTPKKIISLGEATLYRKAFLAS